MISLFTQDFKVIAADSGSSFSAKLNFPSNQIDKSLGYFDLKMNQGQEQEVTVSFTNSGSVATTIDISLNSAKTNSNGVIEYGDSKIKVDPSLKYDFTEIVTAPKSVELQPGESKDVNFQVKMPKNHVEGTIAGGIQLVERGQNNKSVEKGSVVLSELAYVYGFLLQESDEKITPELKLNTVAAGQSNYRNTIYVNYSNIKPTYVENMTTEVQIFKKGDAVALYERKQAKMKMAPNSAINFPVSMSGESMVPGDYTAKIIVTADEGIKEEWTKDFKITKEEADKFNERDVGLVQDKGIDLKMIAYVVVGFIVIVTFVFFISRILKKKGKSSRKKKNKKK